MGSGMNAQGGRENEEWRKDKPVEDPAKMKRWGYISAQPSEYLIHFRGGKLREQSSGQGKTCFKWPSDSVAIIPTTLKEVFFEATQITRENVEVRIRGMVLYRIIDPRRIYKLINFSFRERAEEKLSSAIADMCRSTSKWLVANMTVDECIRKRKEEIATSLKREVAKVVSGADDLSNSWGLAIDNIDIQDVHILDQQIFDALQTEYRNKMKLEAEMSRLATERQLKERNIQTQKEMQELELKAKAESKRLEYETASTIAQEEARNADKIGELKFRQAMQEKEGDAQLKLRQLELQNQQELATKAMKLKQSMQEKENESMVGLRQVELQNQQAAAVRAARFRQAAEEKENESLLGLKQVELQNQQELAGLAARESRQRTEIESEQRLLELKQAAARENFALEREKLEQAELLELLRASTAVKVQETMIRTDRVIHEEQVAHARALQEAQNLIGDSRLRERFIVEALPKIAESFSKQFEKIQISQWGGGEAADPLGPIAGTFAKLLEVARQHGFDLQKK